VDDHEEIKMLNKVAIQLVQWLMGRDLTLVQRNKIVINILDNLVGLPISGIISVNDEGEILINGRSLEIEQVKLLRESARLALENTALKIVNQEVQYAAIVGGIHKCIMPEDLYFYRAALWCSQQQKIQLEILAQQQTEPNY
jgi:hypothetical protein